MIVEAKVKIVNLGGDKTRVDVFNPRFRFRPIISLHNIHANKKVKFFTSWADIDTSKDVTINGTKVSKDKLGNRLIRGMVVVCAGDDTVYVHMPEQVIK